MFSISQLSLYSGTVGICPVTGKFGSFRQDFDLIKQWAPDLVLTMTTLAELDHAGANTLPHDLSVAGIDWEHFPIRDFGVPEGQQGDWKRLSAKSHGILSEGGRVISHCYGGCGRSGMVILRLMCEAGEDPEQALDRLRDVRPCAVETNAQKAWAFAV